MIDAKQLIAEIQDRLKLLNELLADKQEQPRKLQPGDEAPAIEWLKQLEEPWRTEALMMVEIRRSEPNRIVTSFSDALNYSFYWDSDVDKWHDYYKSLKAQGK